MKYRLRKLYCLPLLRTQLCIQTMLVRNTHSLCTATPQSGSVSIGDLPMLTSLGKKTNVMNTTAILCLWFMPLLCPSYLVLIKQNPSKTQRYEMLIMDCTSWCLLQLTYIVLLFIFFHPIVHSNPTGPLSRLCTQTYELYVFWSA